MAKQQQQGQHLAQDWYAVGSIPSEVITKTVKVLPTASLHGTENLGFR